MIYEHGCGEDLVLADGGSLFAGQADFPPETMRKYEDLSFGTVLNADGVVGAMQEQEAFIDQVLYEAVGYDDVGGD
eukprot:6588122-Pyramimonas_sp.AAC.1